MHKAVILAAGLGTRMRQADDAAQLSGVQAAVASSGVKALIPIEVDGIARPFLDFVLASLVEAGYRAVCLVIGPDHHELRAHYSTIAPAKKLTIDFAIQSKPLGTANALASAETFAAGEAVLMINSDNYYPPDALSALRELPRDSHGVAVFSKRAMVEESNIAPDRIQKFAAVEIDAEQRMRRIHEKPTEQTLARLGEPIFVGMNCWRFAPAIFDACRAIPLSPRGEYEVTDAAQHLIDVFNQNVIAVRLDKPVLDLSSRADIASVHDRLRAMPYAY